MRYREFEAASTILEKNNESAPTDAESISMLLQLYDLSGKKEKAMATLEKWIELNPEDKGAIKMLNSRRKQLDN